VALSVVGRRAIVSIGRKFFTLNFGVISLAVDALDGAVSSDGASDVGPGVFFAFFISAFFISAFGVSAFFISELAIAARSGITFFGNSGTGVALAIAAGNAAGAGFFARVALASGFGAEVFSFSADWAAFAATSSSVAAEGSVNAEGSVAAASLVELSAEAELTIRQTIGYLHVLIPIDTAASANPISMTAGLGISFPFSPSHHGTAYKPYTSGAPWQEKTGSTFRHLVRLETQQDDWVKFAGNEKLKG
jgi:hypothetical protein